jgi:hypothetical protein
MGLINGLKTIWGFVAWLLAIRKKFLTEADDRLAPESAKLDRVWLEGIALDLIDGSRDLRWYDRLLRWLGLGPAAGAYLLNLLKSDKLNRALNGDPADRTAAKREIYTQQVSPVDPPAGYVSPDFPQS